MSVLHRLRPRVVSVNIGTPRDEEWAGRLRRTAIDKRSVSGRVTVRTLGIDGDEIADKVHHGGPDKALYAFAREDLDRWGRRLGVTLPDGQFGENLTTVGIDVNDALVGERWRIGSVLVELASVRIPCVVFQNWMGRSGYDSAHWMRRFFEEGRPGPYLRVLEEGHLQVGDEIVVEHRPAHDVSISALFRAVTSEPALLPELLRVDDLTAEARVRAEAYVARQESLSPTLSGSTSPLP